MISCSKKQKILNFTVSLILVFSISFLLAKPQSVDAHVTTAEPLLEAHPAMTLRGGYIPFQATGLAAPLAAPTPDTAHTDEDSPIDIDVLSNDGGPTAISGLIISGTQGTISINANQTVHYDPTVGLNHLPAGQAITDTFQYTIISGTLPIDTLVSVGVTGVNDNPTPLGDSANTSENTTININASNVLNNDTDPDGDPLVITGVITSGTKGSVSWNASSQTIHYNPGTAFDYLAVGETDTDTFQYAVSDGHGGSANATVTVTIDGVNDNPTPVADDETTDENAALDIPAASLLANDKDPEGDTLTVTGVTTTGTKGSVSWNATSQTVHYDPGTVFNSLSVNTTDTDSFGYTVSDGHGGTATATVTVTINGVNDNPTAGNDEESTGENTAAVFTDLLANDHDPDTNDTLTIASVDTSGGTKGTVSVVSGGKSVHYDPGTAFDYLGQGLTANDTFGYTVSDGHGGTATATVTVTINGANDNPTPVNDTVSTSENTAADFTNLLANDGDPDTGDKDLLTITSVDTSGGTKGTVTINSGSKSVHYNPGTAFDYLGQGLTANDTFGYTASDGHGGTATATVTVTINGANDNPTPVNDTVSTGENTAADFNNLLANDGDPDTGDKELLTITSVDTGGGTKGTVSIISGGEGVHYDPGMSFNNLGRSQTTTDSFDYTVSDGHGGTASATVTVTIIGANDPPIAENDTYTTPANKTLTIAALDGVLANDNDPDTGDTLTTALVINPSHGLVSLFPSGGFIYTPTLNYHGLDHFNYHASDGIASSPDVTVTVGVDVTNQPPVVVADTATTQEDTPVAIHVLANDYDPDGSLDLSKLRVLPNSPSHGSTQVYTPTGVITYTPALNFNGSDAFQYEIYDKDSVLPLNGKAPVTVTITAVNDPPKATSPNNLHTLEDTSLDINLTGNVSDVENDLNPSSLQVITPAGHGTASVKSAGAGSLIVTYAPSANYNGLDQFGYRICDTGSLCASANVSLTVDAVNDPPVAANDHFYSTSMTLTVPAPGVLANDSDVDTADHLTAALAQPNTRLSLKSDGSFSYVPELDPNLNIITDTFKYRAYDGKAYSQNTTVTITVDTGIPQVEWLEPVQKGGQIYVPQPNELIPLSFVATDNIGIARVEIFRWDAFRGVTVMIANLNHKPFFAELDSRQLNFGWNQIFIWAFDEAGNINEYLNPAKNGYFWVYRYGALFPLVSNGAFP
jgi:VCBS repeat-containing protein